MIQVLPRFLSDQHIQRIVSLSGASHHDDDGGHIGSSFRTNKPYHMFWLAKIIRQAVSDLPIDGLVGVDPNVQVYRLSGIHSSVPLHTDEDFFGPDRSIARYSILLRLNSAYKGGETRFFGIDVPNVPVGGGVVFLHDIPHEGLPLVSGEKLALKTDLFIER